MAIEIPSLASLYRREDLFSRRTALFFGIGVTTLLIASAWMVVAFAATLSGPVRGIGGKCLDNNGGRIANGNKVQLWQCNKGAAQNWLLPSSQAIRMGSSGYCLDVRGGSKRVGAVVWLWTCNGAGSQHWKLNRSGTIQNPQSGLCLAAMDGKSSNGTLMTLAKCELTPAQIWKAPQETTPPPPTETPGLTNPGSLTDYSGPTTISSGTHVIDSKRFTSRLTINGGNVTIRNSSFTFTDYYQILQKGGTVTVEHSEFDGNNSLDDTTGIAVNENATIRYSTFKRHVNAMRLGANSLAEYNVITEPNTNFEDAHTDGIEVYGGKNITIRHNSINIRGGKGETGCVNIATDFASISNVTVEDNDFTGGTYSLYARLQGAGSSLSGVKIRSNRWHTPNTYGTHSVSPTSAISEWASNTINGNQLSL